MSKKDFYLVPTKPEYRSAIVKIIGDSKDSKPYISFNCGSSNPIGILEGRDLERFAVNILKAMDSKLLKKSKDNPDLLSPNTTK